MLYKVDVNSKKLIELEYKRFADLNLKERFDIQEWVEKTPDILGEDLLPIGKEVILDSGKRLDLLFLDTSASLVILELKRDDSGSSAEWQAIKYASYCSTFLPREIYGLYADYIKKSEEEAEQKIKEFVEDIENLNKKQRIILASREFNSEVISAVLWLRGLGVDIQCTRLSPHFDSDTKELFVKPETIIPLPEAKDYIERTERKKRYDYDKEAEWTGFYFVNLEDDDEDKGPRNWNDYVKFGFISGGGGRRYSNGIRHRLKEGDKIYAYIKSHGYVGLGEVIGEPSMAREFAFEKSGSKVPRIMEKFKNSSDSEDDTEWCIGVKWIKTVDKDCAKKFEGMPAHRHVVCKLRDSKTLAFLEKEFAVSSDLT